MPTFRYTAKRGPHDLVEGLMEAESRTDLLSHLAKQGYIPVRVREEPPTANGALAPAPGSGDRNERVSAACVNVFTRQFASLVRSQVPLLRALGILTEQTSDSRLRRVLGAISEDIRQGHTLSGALGAHPGVFSPLYVNLIRSAELGGMLETVLERLAAKADRDEALRAKVRGALVYPLFIGCVGVLTVAFLLTFVVPRLLGLFAGFGDRLPLPTRLLLAISGVMSKGWFWGVGLLLVCGLVALWRARGSRARFMIDRWTLRLPAIGMLIRQLELARFAHSFGVLLNHGISALEAVEVAIAVVRHQVIRQELTSLLAHLRQGGSLAAGLAPLRVVTPFVVNTVAVGEETGKVGEALIEVANFYEQEVERQLQMAAALLEPAMVLAVGALTGWLVMAILLPIFELSTITR